MTKEPDPRDDPLTDPIELLQRWETFGAVWRVVARSPDRVTVALYRCDGGEEVERLTSNDQRLLRYIDESGPGPSTP